MYPKRRRCNATESDQEKSLQVAVDIGHDVTLIDDAAFESDDDTPAAPSKVPTFIAICDRCEVGPSS